jgi:SAM-dependent methyltransferase
MKSFLRNVYLFFLSFPGLITPRFVQKRIDTERFSIDRFVFDTVVKQIHPENKVLDAGAGSGRYRNALSFARYEATDFADIFDQGSKDKMDFICSLDDIPKPDNTYDVIVNMQVLEHVEYPEKVISELHRILKPGGKLFLSTSQTFGIHGAPYNFFFYTRYGLESLFRRAGFEDIRITPRGGVFWVLAKIFNILPTYTYYQLAYSGYKFSSKEKPTLRSPLLAVVLLPFYIVLQILFGILLPFILFYLDGLDKQSLFTLGYGCCATKKI